MRGTHAHMYHVGIMNYVTHLSQMYQSPLQEQFAASHFCRKGLERNAGPATGNDDSRECKGLSEIGEFGESVQAAWI